MQSGIVDPELLARLRALRPGCEYRALEGARWGVLLTPPAPDQPPTGGGEGGLRLVLFCSFWIGQAALQAVLAYLRRYPGRARLVGVVTDDPVSPQARISLRKRAWAAMSESERLEVKLALVGTALDAGVPVYTGEVKTAGFRRALARWRPDAIITCGFGQVLDASIIGAAPYGAYNCHPTDLANGHGAGPAPWDDMAARNVTHTVWSVHQMTEVVDAGPVIGQTPPINVADAQGRLIPDPRAFFYKVLPPIGWMVLRVLDGLVLRRGMGLREPLRHVELDAAMPPALRWRLLRPVAPNWRDAPIPTPGQEEFDALRGEAAPQARAAAVGG
jgi:folate-dependent phosphoribosylglycinamide formyltransferase PurN